MSTTFEWFELNRSILKHILLVLVMGVTAQSSHAQPKQTVVEQWEIFELSLNGPREGNPFLDVALSARFIRRDRVVEVNGFYDGDGKYLVRFMPDAVGQWSYVTESDDTSLDGKKGSFRVRRRDTVFPVRHHLLCVDTSRRQARRADPRNTQDRVVQQDAHVRVPKELQL